MILVSACLAGIRCRYDGQAKTDPQIQRMVIEGKALPVCPEAMAGLGIPRDPTELTGDGSMVLEQKAQAITKSGADVTAAFLRGAQRTAQICQAKGITKAILKDGSPSCGSSWIYDGSFSGTKRAGMGICARILQQEGISVESR